MAEIFGGDDHITNKVSYYANAINENYMQYVKVDTQLREKLKQAINEDCLLYTSPSPRDRG